MAYRPFSKEGAAILAKAPAKKARELPVDRRVAELEGPGALPVFADWLLGHGDPWGELIALRLAGKHAEAIAHFDQHVDSFTGDVPLDQLEWRDGVIVAALVEGKGTILEERLAELLSLRTTVRLCELELAGTVSRDALALLSKKAPATLRRLKLGQKLETLASLALPQLEALVLDVRRTPIESLFDAQLSGLRALRLTSIPALSAGFLEKLLEWPQLRQLRRLDFEDDSIAYRTLSDAGLVQLLGGKAKLTHFKTMWVELAGRGDSAKPAKAFFGTRSARALKEDQRRLAQAPESDVFELED